MKKEKTIRLQPQWILPMHTDGEVLEGHDLIIQGEQILAIEPRQQADARPCDETLALPGQVLLPGLVNTHTHLAMNLLRGLADDLPLMTWLNEHIWPAEGQWVSDAFVADGARLAMAELIRGGVTCFNDQYFFASAVAKEAEQIGLRGLVSLLVIGVPTRWASSIDEYFDKALALHEEISGYSRVGTVWSPHAPYTVDDAALERIARHRDEMGLDFHIHLHESAQEIEDSLKQYGERPLARLQRLGLMDARTLAIHMTQMTEAEIRFCAEAGVRIAHCPESNMKLASGIAPVHALTQAGVTVGIGTDGAASNNDLDLLGEARTASFLAKVSTGNPEALPAWQALAMLTREGAKALGMGDRIGTLEAGKQADVISIDLNTLESLPLYDLASHLIYCVSRQQVQNVWVAGQPLLRERRLCTLNETDLHEVARTWQQRIRPN